MLVATARAGRHRAQPMLWVLLSLLPPPLITSLSPISLSCTLFLLPLITAPRKDGGAGQVFFEAPVTPTPEDGAQPLQGVPV